MLGDGPRALPWRAEPKEPTRAIPADRRSVPERRGFVLYVVLKGPVDEGDVAAREGRRGQPLIVEGVRRRGRERQREIQQLASKQGRGAGDRVREEQRGQVRVVVASLAPEGR